MKKIPMNKATLISLLKHAKGGKKICALVPTDRHVASCYGYLVTEGWHYGYDVTVEPSLPSPLPSSDSLSLPSRLHKLIVKGAGEVVFVSHTSHMAPYEGHTMIRLMPKI